MWPFTRPSREIRIQTVLIDPLKLRLAQWQGDRNLTNSAGKVMAEGTVKLMLQVLGNESPALWSMDVNTSLESRALQQARIEGYNMALKNLEAMAVHVAFTEAIEATFEPEQREEQE